MATVPLPARVDGWFAAYGAFVARLDARSLVTLAIVTASLGLKFLMNLQMASVKDNSQIILIVATVYLIGISLFIWRFRRREMLNQPPQPQTPSQIPNILVFLKSGYPVTALAFFTALDDPLKSIQSLYVPGICLCCYFHILVILAVLRRKEDYGISDGCLGAAYALLFSMTDSNLVRLVLIIPTIVLSGLRNLQFNAIQAHLNLQLPLVFPTIEPPQVSPTIEPPQVSPKTRQQRKEERREANARKTKIYQPQAQVASEPHRRGSSL
ncbi:hypothetical protein ISN44_As09g012030 [Arabidopsis suecica]|uniref:Uncharacterized protein n=1 Tax=Arabidopsis suecica TaxID=45249 RepID=A0A8T2AIR7_ARASU|nr:hypothetical protein ISN44_As09g012030 [Arabidopsis suecica]